MDDKQLDALNRRFEGASAEVLLQWASDQFGHEASFGTGFGVEGCVLIHLIATRHLPIDIFTLDTGLFFDETYALRHQLEQRYDVDLRQVTPEVSLEQQAARFGPGLWKDDPNACCGLRKVAPLGRALQNKLAWISAIRQDQTRYRRNVRAIERDDRFGLVKLSPLRNWTEERVWRFVEQHDIPYNPLHRQGYPSIGCRPCTSPVLPGEDPRAGRWRGFEKTECGLHQRIDHGNGQRAPRGEAPKPANSPMASPTEG